MSSDVTSGGTPPAAAAAAVAPPATAATATATAEGGRKRKRDESNQRSAVAEPAGAEPASAGPTSATAVAAPAPPLLIGAQGGEWIRTALATSHPAQFIQQFQAEHGVASQCATPWHRGRMGRPGATNGWLTECCGRGCVCWSDAALEASLSFLDLFSPRRGGVYSSMLQELNDSLTERIHKGLVDKEK